jgi:hypothetical protein
MLRHVTLVRTEVSKDRSASIIKVTRIGELGTTLAVTSNRRTLWRNTMQNVVGCNMRTWCCWTELGMREGACLASVKQACAIRNNVSINHRYQPNEILSWFFLPRNLSRWSGDMPIPSLILNLLLTIVYYFRQFNDLVVTELRNTDISCFEIRPTLVSFFIYGPWFRDVSELGSTEASYRACWAKLSYCQFQVFITELKSVMFLSLLRPFCLNSMFYRLYAAFIWNVDALYLITTFSKEFEDVSR